MKQMNKENLLKTLKDRFTKHMYRHPGVSWDEVEKRLHQNERVLEVIYNMEETGGEPDLVTRLFEDNKFTFVDCSKETPKNRRSFCYDRLAWESRKEFKPLTSALEHAKEIGVIILNEIEYRKLQTIEPFDLKTSTWVLTPEPIRSLGGAIFCDRRYDHVFTYHNGAESYYASRAYRGYVSLS